MADPTTNYGQDLPDVGGDTGAWGTINNTLHQFWDTTVKAVSDVADAAMPKAGGTFTGNIKVLTDTFTAVDKDPVGASPSLDLSAARYFYEIGRAHV